MAGPVAMLREIAARRDAIASYEALYDHFATSAQLYAGTSLQQTVGAVAVRFLVAADAERHDPEPRPGPVATCCQTCLVYRLLPEAVKGPHPLS